MVIVKLQGGLGNQLFQYAVGRSLLQKDDFLYLDHHFLDKHRANVEHFSSRIYELGIFENIKVRKAKPVYVSFFNNQNSGFRLLRKWLSFYLKNIRQDGNSLVDFKKYGTVSHLYLNGYFQSETYFKNIRNQLLRELKFPLLDEENSVLKNIIRKSKNAVSVHIRRGDYVRSEVISKVHGVLPAEYYQKALDILQSTCPQLELFLFSDDIDWVKKNFSRENSKIHYLESNNGHNSWKDMALMTYCKHHVIANSSFSWWGAWLSDRQGEVFAPVYWFNPHEVRFQINDFIPTNWTIINYD